jgi:nucleoid-associated protein YgaU
VAQETKVGLVVGLGFIVCFAMVLANRGAAERIRPQLPYQLFTSPAPPSGAVTGLRSEQRAQGLKGGAKPTRTAELPAGGQAVSSGQSRPAADANSELRQEPGVIADPERFTRRRGSVPKPLELPDPAVVAAADEDEKGMTLLAGGTAPPEGDPEPAETVASRGPDRTAPPLAELPAALAPYADQFERVSRRELSSPAPAAAPAAREAGREGEHVVEPGDTLSKIARRYYGSASRDIVSALYEANRTAMASPNAAVVGRTLRLPVVEGITPKPGSSGGEPRETVVDNMKAPRDAAGTKTAAHDAVAETKKAEREAAGEAKTPARGDKPSYRLYTVRKGDLLSTIAQEQLGNSKRWKEILALNKKICSDVRNLPCGVEIRIPIDTLADAR